MKYTQANVMLIKKDIERLSSVVSSLNQEVEVLKGILKNKKEYIDRQIAESREMLKKVRSGIDGKMLSLFFEEREKINRIHFLNDEIERLEGVHSLLRRIPSPVKEREQNFTFVNDVIKILREELDSLSSEFDNETLRVQQVRSARIKAEKLLGVSVNELQSIDERANALRRQIASLESITEKKEKPKVSEFINEHQILSRLRALRSEQEEILQSRNKAEREFKTYENLSRNLKKAIGEIEIPTPNFSFEKQVARKLLEELEDLEKKRIDEQKSYEQYRELRDGIEQHIESLRDERDVLLQKNTRLSKENESLAKLNASLIEENQEKENNLRDARGEIVALQKYLSSLGLEIQAAEVLEENAKNSLVSKEKSLHDLNMRKKQIEKEIKRMNSEKIEMGSQIDYLKNEIEKGNDKNGKLGREYLRLEQKISAIKELETKAVSQYRHIATALKK